MPYKIGLDRGHGGADPGAVKYVREVDVNTMVTRQLEAMLAADPNYEPVLICPYDQGLSINQRAAAANAAGVRLMISNHFNAGGGNGWECYPEVPRAATHPRYQIHADALRFARLLAQHMSDIQQLRGDKGVQYKYSGTDSYFGVIRLVNRPAVLIENAFVDNQQDIEDFNNAEKIKKLSGRQYNAICQFFGTVPLFDKNANLTANVPVQPRTRYRVYTLATETEDLKAAQAAAAGKQAMITVASD